MERPKDSSGDWITYAKYLEKLIRALVQKIKELEVRDAK